MAETKSPARGLTPASPLSSPRLPSPPPLPELQLGPRSPSIGAPTAEIRLDSATTKDEGAGRRARPGTSAAEMARGPPFLPLHQLESPFQLQEYLKSYYSKLTREGEAVTPITKETAMQLATPPTQQDTGEPVDRNLWLYELCRFLVQRSNRLLVSFFGDNPPCSSQTCPEMRASEWQYLCAVHEPPKSCCAIDYCCHTLDWAANVLTSTKHFPSRLSLGGEGGSAYQSMRQLTNIFRRVYRIYAHAWFQHREVFWHLEGEEGLYKFFKTVCDAYQLIPEDNYTIPPEAEGDREDEPELPATTPDRAPVQIMRHDTHTQNNALDSSAQQPQPPSQTQTAPFTPEQPAEHVALTTGATTRRHRHTPSTGTQVTMIAEGIEEEEGPEDKAMSHASPQVLQTVQAVQPAASVTAPPATLTPPQLGRRKSRENSPSQITLPSTDTADALRQPEDPTPTPEQHHSDPFNDTQSTSTATSETSSATNSVASSASSVPVQESSQGPAPPSLTSTVSYSRPPQNKELDEPPTPATATRTEPAGGQGYLPILDTAQPPQSQQQSQAQASTPIEQAKPIHSDTVHSPSGGSIRTISSDWLSAILGHEEEEKPDGETSEDFGEIKLAPKGQVAAQPKIEEDKTGEGAQDNKSEDTQNKTEDEIKEEAPAGVV